MNDNGNNRRYMQSRGTRYRGELDGKGRDLSKVCVMRESIQRETDTGMNGNKCRAGGTRYREVLYVKGGNGRAVLYVALRVDIYKESNDTLPTL